MAPVWRGTRPGGAAGGATVNGPRLDFGSSRARASASASGPGLSESFETRQRRVVWGGAARALGQRHGRCAWLPARRRRTLALPNCSFASGSVPAPLARS